MAQDIFLKIESITGESVDERHKGEIEIDSFSWGAENPTTIGSATGGAGAGKVKLNQFIIKKRCDLSTPPLFGSLCSGIHFKDVTLTVRKAGTKQQDFLVLKMSTVFLTKFEVNADENDSGVVHEQVTFVFGS